MDSCRKENYGKKVCKYSGISTSVTERLSELLKSATI